MKVTLHPVDHSGARKNRYCGPSALSAIAGINTGDAAALLRKVSGKRSIKGTSHYHMNEALYRLGYRLAGICPHARLQAVKPLTLNQWSKVKGSGTYLLNVGRHWAVVSGRRYVCGLTGNIVSLKASPKKRARVKTAYLVERVREVKLSEVIPQPPSKSRYLTDPNRRAAKRLAAQYDISIETDSPADTIWVYPPSCLHDEHGEMPNDPYADSHYHDDWASALKAVETYVAALPERPLGQATATFVTS